MNTPVTGMPRIVLRLEGATVFVAALVAYRYASGSWALFAGLFLVPDLSMLAYLAGSKPGAVGYNALHTYLAPGLLGAAMALHVIPAFWPAPLIWVCHIGFDRALGFGLKYRTAFRDTHLGHPGAGTAAA
jgi:hypothetical protein